jgi:hypothetical protein
MLPNLIVIGAGKCGTTSLYHYLGAHPEVSMARVKELRFFSERWDRGVDWYESQFAGSSGPVVGEASPQYTHFPSFPETAARMHSVIPEAKLIYLVRDPLERIVSSYIDDHSGGREDRPLHEVIGPALGEGFSTNGYISRSRYCLQLEQYLAHFPPEQLLVVTREELLDARRTTLRRIFGFLGVDASFESPTFDQVRNTSSMKRRVEGLPGWLPRDPRPKATGRTPWRWRARVKRALYKPFLVPIETPRIEGDLRERLIEHLKPDVDQLRAMTGLRIDHWSL